MIRLSADGEVELCNVEDGEPYCTTHITPRIGGPPVGLMAGGDNIPPVAVVTEGSHRLVAIDVRTGEPRWRFASRSGGEFRMSGGRAPHDQPTISPRSPHDHTGAHRLERRPDRLRAEARHPPR